MPPNAGSERCGWAGSGEMMVYHDTEWGVPLHDDPRAFRISDSWRAPRPA